MTGDVVAMCSGSATTGPSDMGRLLLTRVNGLPRRLALFLLWPLNGPDAATDSEPEEKVARALSLFPVDDQVRDNVSQAKEKRAGRSDLVHCIWWLSLP